MYGDASAAACDRTGSMCYLSPPSMVPNDMRKCSKVSPRRLSDISPQLRQLKYLVVDESIKEELKCSRSVEYINNVSVEERILRITGYYGYQPWSAIYKGECHSRENATISDNPASVDGAQEESGDTLQKLHLCLRVTAAYGCHALRGVAVVLCVCAAWAGSTQLARLTFKQVDAPFTLTWFTTSWNCLLFPLYYVGHLCKGAEWQTPNQRYRECCTFFGEDGLTGRVFLTKVTPFGLLWILGTYLYMQALCRIPTTDASALFCCNRAFVFLLSWIVLRDRFLGTRIVAAIFTIAGIVMMTYADGFHSRSVIGISLVVASASMCALYKVLYKLVLGTAKLGEAALFLTVLGGANITFISFIPALLYFTGTERFGPPASIPWTSICGAAALLLVFNLLVNFGIPITYPSLISLGVVLSVPVNAVMDVYTCEIRFNSVRLIAVLVVCLGFVLLLLPADWDQALLQFMTRLRQHHRPSEGVDKGAIRPKHPRVTFGTDP